MATPKKTKKGYTAHVYLGLQDGKKKYKSITAPTLRDWKMKEAQARMEFNENAGKAADITIGEAVSKYIDNRTNVLSPTTLHSYRWVRDLVLGDFAHQSARDVTAGDLQAWVNTISATLSPKSVRNALGVVIPALDMFYPGRKFNITRPQKAVHEYHIPDDEEIRSLLSASDGDLKKAIYLSAFGSLRRGEICGLRHSDVLRDMNAVYVHAVRIKDRSGWIYKDHPKNDSSVRTVIYPKEIIAMLGNGDPDEYVVKSNPAQITYAFKKLAEKVGLKCTFHGMRHYSASLMHALGVPDQYIMERGGWKSDSTLKAIYRNTLKDKNHQFTKLTNKYFDDHFSAKKAL